VPKQLSDQPQNVPVQFSQLPSKVQQLLLQQIQQSGQGLKQLQQSKFLLLNAQQTSNIKPQQRGEVQQPSSANKQVSKKNTQAASKQTAVTNDQPSQQQQQQQHTGHKQQSHNKHSQQHQKIHLQEAKLVEDVSTDKQQIASDYKLPDKPQQQIQQPTLENAVDKEGTMSEQQKETVGTIAMKSPVKKETEVIETLTSSLKKEVDVILCFVCLEERFVQVLYMQSSIRGWGCIREYAWAVQDLLMVCR